MCLLNKRDGKEEAEYNELAEAGQHKDFAQQLLHQMIKREYKDQVKNPQKESQRRFIIEGLLNFYLKSLMFMYSFKDKVNCQKDLLLLIKHLANHFNKFYLMLFDNMPNEVKEEFTILQCSIEEMTEKIQTEVAIKKGL